MINQGKIYSLASEEEFTAAGTEESVTKSLETGDTGEPVKRQQIAKGKLSTGKVGRC